MSDKPQRYHIVKHTFSVIHEIEADYPCPEFLFAENRCSSNVVNDLEAAVAIETEFRICSICCSHEAEYVAAYETLEEAEAVGGYDTNPKRIRAKLEKDK
jgi:hypothetical protein